MAVVEMGKKSQQMLKVEVTSKAHVKPAKKVGRKECQLVTFDLPYLAFYYNQKVLFYKGGGEIEDVVSKLKNGLEVVLGEYYQLAGKLGRYEDEVFRVEYDDDMEGVEVIEAIADAVAVADLTAEDCPSTFKDLVPYNGVLNFEGLHRPLLAVQITKLSDGLALGCAFNHAILDGTSTWHFMSAWAHACSGSKASPAPPPPFLERTKVRDTRMKLDLPVGPAENGSAPPEPRPSPEPNLREKIFRFSEAAIDRIKSTVNASNGSRPFTTFQALSSHVWRAVTRARGLKPEDPTVFTVFADCRRRVEPPMPETYFGNLIQAVFTGLAAGQLAANPPEFGAAAIRAAIEAHDARAIDARNGAWEANPVVLQYKDAGVNCVAVGSSPRFKVYEVDFGWGPPESVRSGSNNRFDGMVYLYQGKAGGRSIDVEMSLEEATMEKLEKDEDFLLRSGV